MSSNPNSILYLSFRLNLSSIVWSHIWRGSVLIFRTSWTPKNIFREIRKMILLTENIFRWNKQSLSIIWWHAHPLNNTWSLFLHAFIVFIYDKTEQTINLISDKTDHWISFPHMHNACQISCWCLCYLIHKLT